MANDPIRQWMGQQIFLDANNPALGDCSAQPNHVYAQRPMDFTATTPRCFQLLAAHPLSVVCCSPNLDFHIGQASRHKVQA
jgi:hypothetical protein